MQEAEEAVADELVAMESAGKEGLFLHLRRRPERLLLNWTLN